jgi:hypothetical protein
MNVDSALRRAKRVECKICGQPGASIRCYKLDCANKDMAFHLLCARSNGFFIKDKVSFLFLLLIFDQFSSDLFLCQPRNSSGCHCSIGCNSPALHSSGRKSASFKNIQPFIAHRNDNACWLINLPKNWSTSSRPTPSIHNPGSYIPCKN